MKVTARRLRSDSARAAISAHQNAAAGAIEPPEHVRLRPGDRPFWDAIVLARPRDTWTDADLALAAQLARTMADIEGLEKQIDADGLLIDGKVNPACDLLDKMQRRALAVSRQLMVTTLATVGRAQDINQGATLQREAQAQLDLLTDNPLIPTLRVVQ